MQNIIAKIVFKYYDSDSDSDLFSTTYILINKEQKSALYKVVGEVAKSIDCLPATPKHVHTLNKNDRV